MSDQTGTTHTSTHSTSGSSSGLAFIVGALVVAVGVMGYFLFVGDQGSDDVTISIEGAGEAAAAVEGAIEDATN